MQRKLLFLFVLLSIIFAGCGSIVHAYAGPTNTELLPDTLEATGPFQGVEKTITITDQASVQALYKELYALPRRQPPPAFPHLGRGPVSFSYRLQFFAQQRMLKEVVLQTISFYGLELAPHDYRQVTEHLWSVFAQTIHEPRNKLLSPYA